MIFCTITFTSVSADRVSAAAVAYKTDVIDGMEYCSFVTTQI
jgi:hypothetical protein